MYLIECLAIFRILALGNLSIERGFDFSISLISPHSLYNPSSQSHQSFTTLIEVFVSLMNYSLHWLRLMYKQLKHYLLYSNCFDWVKCHLLDSNW